MKILTYSLLFLFLQSAFASGNPEIVCGKLGKRDMRCENMEEACGVQTHLETSFGVIDITTDATAELDARVRDQNLQKQVCFIGRTTSFEKAGEKSFEAIDVVWSDTLELLPDDLGLVKSRLGEMQSPDCAKAVNGSKLQLKDGIEKIKLKKENFYKPSADEQ